MPIHASAFARDLIGVEAAMTRKHKPLWNSCIDGFGNHDPGSGRHHQAKSEWDLSRETLGGKAEGRTARRRA